MKSRQFFFLRFVFLLFIISGLFVKAVQGQVVCPNADFSSGNFSNWIGFTGTYTNCCTVSGLVGGRHTIMASPINDPQVGTSCTPLPVLMPGKNYSVRLGNPGTGAQAERLVYSFQVSVASNVFMVHYAVVLEDPGHPIGSQPKFTIRARDSFGNIISAPGADTIIYSGGPGLNSCGLISYSNWTSHPILLSGYEGSTISIELTTYDCASFGHFGYAYVLGECTSINLAQPYCAGDTVNLYAPSGFSSYLWNTGDTTSAISVPNPVSGTGYSVIYSDGTFTDTLYDTIQVVSISAAFADTLNCTTYSAYDQSTSSGGNIAQWEWDFGDGGTSNIQNPVYTYSAAGTYTVSLVVTDETGCRDTTTKPVTVTNVPPQAFFTMSSNPLCLPDTLFIQENSIPGNSPISTYNWNFGDGTIGSGSGNFYHLYPQAGTYQISLQATDAAGCTDAFVLSLSADNQPAPLVSGDTATCLNLPASLNGTISPGNNYYWDFDDFTVNDSSGINQSHTFMISPSQFPDVSNVTLTEITPAGCRDSVTFPVTLYPVPCEIMAFPGLSLCAGDSIGLYYNSLLTCSPGTNIQFSFAPGVNAYNNTPVYFTPSGPGNANVTMTSTNQHGCSTNDYRVFTVYALPSAMFSYDAVVCLPFTDTLIEISTPGDAPINQWTWEVDGNLVSTMGTLVQNYSVSGNYLVNLLVSDTNGCTDSHSENVSAFNPPTSSFTWNWDGNSIDFTANATGAMPLNYTWFFGDGDIDSTSSVQHVYSSGGSYWVCLEVKDVNGCISTSCDTVVVQFPGVQEQSSLANIHVFPNPSKGEFHFSGSEIIRKLSVFDLPGKLVKEANFISEKGTLNLSGYESGVYFLVFSTNQGRTVTRKLVLH